MATPFRKRSIWEKVFKGGDLGVWLCGLCLDLTILMATGLLMLVLWNSLRFFWPHDLVELQLTDGSTFLGSVQEKEKGDGSIARPEDRIQVKVGNRRSFGFDFLWVDERQIEGRTYPRDAITVERTEYGDLHGYLDEIRAGGEIVSKGEDAWSALPQYLGTAEGLLAEAREIEHEMGGLNKKVESARLKLRKLELADKTGSTEYRQLEEEMGMAEAAFEEKRQKVDALFLKASSTSLMMRLTDGQVLDLPISRVVRIFRPNEMGAAAKSRVYLSKWWEFLTGEPRESNTEGGIFPAIFGTFFLVILMSIAAVPLGVVAALYLGEYAKDGYLVRAVRIAVQNLAGVPSIVFGVFGLGFFVYGVGGTIDKIFFPEKLPTPTFGTGGVLWASLTLALLTVPVVIVATEEALRAVPKSLREASYGLGATQWQTIRRIALPSALPGILTGVILSVARGAGEVAPLMITGVVKLAPALPLDGEFPYVHLERKFMHMAFHIYDVGFQSPNVEAAKPMVYMTTLLLLTLVVSLNLIAIQVRTKLREKYKGSAI